MPGKIARILRQARFIVDEGEPLIELEIARYCILSIGTSRGGHIYNIRVHRGQQVQAGTTIAEIGVGPIETFEQAVFIAYRRSDSRGYTGRIYDAIVRDLGRHQVFRDIGSLRPGRDFRQQVAAALQRTRVMIVVIGPDWLKAADSHGHRRIDDPDDLHRTEIRTALERGGIILPVLLGSAHMPPADELPEDIRALASVQALEISDRSWEADAQQLSETVAELLPPRRTSISSRYLRPNGQPALAAGPRASGAAGGR